MAVKTPDQIQLETLEELKAIRGLLEDLLEVGDETDDEEEETPALPRGTASTDTSEEEGETT